MGSFASPPLPQKADSSFDVRLLGVEAHRHNPKQTTEKLCTTYKKNEALGSLKFVSPA